MKRAGIVAVGLLLLARPELADASGSCGGGGGGGGSSSGGSDSDSGSTGGSDSGGSDGPSTPACVDDSDVVGYRTCTRFGAWAAPMRLPHVFIELGSGMRRAPSRLGGQTGEVAHDGESFAYRTIAPEPGGAGHDLALGMTARLGVGLRRGLYAAAEVELGGLVAPAHATTEMMSSGTLGTPTVTQERGTSVAALGVLGVRGATRAGSLGVEVAGGVQGVHYAFTSHYLACETESTIGAAAPVLEARVRGEWFLSPWANVGVAVGASAIERGAWMGSLYLGLHSRAFGGGR